MGRDPTQLNGLRVSLSKQEHSWQGEKAINKDNINKRRVGNPILCANLFKSYSIYKCTKFRGSTAIKVRNATADMKFVPSKKSIGQSANNLTFVVDY